MEDASDPRFEAKASMEKESSYRSRKDSFDKGPGKKSLSRGRGLLTTFFTADPSISQDYDHCHSQGETFMHL